MQSIIVYRNPLEAAIWESGAIFPVIAGVVVAVIVALATNWVCEKIFRCNSKYTANIVGVTSIAAVIGVVTFLL